MPEKSIAAPKPHLNRSESVHGTINLIGDCFQQRGLAGSRVILAVSAIVSKKDFDGLAA
jgi:hypothetical protein